MLRAITVDFAGGLKINAHMGDHVIRTDQPRTSGGEDAAPSPYGLFLSSLATCAGYYVLAFCRARELSTEGVRVIQRIEPTPQGAIGSISIEVEVPADFPKKYLPGLEKAVHSCSVKKTILNPPEFRVQALHAS